MDIIISLIGYFLLWAAAGIYRPPGQMKLFPKHWWVTLLLIVVGVQFIKYSILNL